MQFCNGMHRLAAVLFIALVLLCFTSANASRRKWRSLHQTAFGEADGQMECGSQFHDIQSKWLQSKLVLRALNWQIIESASASHRFNLTIVVHSVLKIGGSKSGPRLRISNGSRITVGEFSGALSRRQRSRQRQQCTPSRLRSNDKGYIFFLKPTLDPTYFKHSFLPIKFRSRRLRKFDRVSCGRRNRCPKAPWIVKAIPQGVTPHKGSREVSMRFVCGARGEPAPIVRWLKNGANLVLDDRVRAQMKKRSHGIVSRLTIRPVKLTDAGNYTCVFTNLQGSVNTTFEIGVAEILNAERQLFRKDREMPAYVCDSANKTHCQNGGTCVINNFDGKPHCVCLIVSNETAENCVEFQTYVDRRVNRAIDRVLTATTIGVAATVIIGIVVLSWYLARRRRLDQLKFKKRQTERLMEHKEVQVRSPTDNHRSEAPKSAAAAATTVKTANKSTSTMQTGIESAMLPQSAMMDRRPRHQAAAFTDPFAAPLVHQQPAVPHHANEFQVLPPPRQNGPQQQQQRFSSGAISRQVSSGAASSGGRSRCPSGGCYPYDYHQSPSAGEASTFEARIYPVFDYGDCLQFDEQAAANCFAMEASSAAGGGLVDTGSSAGRSDLLMQELAKINSLEQQLYNLQQQQQRQQQSINAAYQSAYYPAARMSHQQLQHQQHQQQQQQVLQSVSSSMVYSPNFAKSGHAPGHSAASMFGSASAAYYSAQDAAPPSPNESDRLLTSSSSSAVQGALSTGSTTFENQAFFGRSTPARRRHQQQQPNPQLMPVANNSVRGQYFGFSNS